LAPERTINRQNALTASARLVAELVKTNPDSFDDIDVPAMVIHYARQFEAYTTGDLDRDEAMKMVEEYKGGLQT
jgi:hypothetical protein